MSRHQASSSSPRSSSATGAAIPLEPGPGRSASPRGTLTSGALAVAAAVAALGCDFPAKNGVELMELIQEFGNEYAPHSSINQAKSARGVVYDVPGKIQVQHGHTCATPTDFSGVQVHESAAFPAGYDEGTVIFNGSVAAYSGGEDHHVRLLGSGAILKVGVKSSAAGRELSWDTAGALTDDNQNRFEWCYFYTLVFWRRASDGLQAIVTDPTSDKLFGEFDKAPSPVHQISGSIQTAPGLIGAYGGPRALLPRGSAMWFAANLDHELIQAGFDLGSPSFSANTVSWTSRSLLKDDDSWRELSSAELVEVMNGPSVSMWQPETVSHLVSSPTPHWVSESTAFALQPEAPFGSVLSPCVASPPENVTDQYVVDVPYSYAVPMLTGWELSQACDDTNVHQIGAYLHSFSFTRSSNGRSGTLRYTVVSSLSDDGGGKLGRARNKVTILGFNPVLPGKLGTIGQFTSPLPTSNAP